MAKRSKNDKMSFGSVLKVAFPFYSPDDDKENSTTYESGAGYTGSAFHEREKYTPDANSSLVTNGRSNTDRLYMRKLPNDRFLRYDVYKEMEDDSTMSAALDVHLSNALSVPSTGGMSVYLKPKDDKFNEYVAQLNRELITPINANLMNWCYTMAVYGVNYVRPYVEKGKGITHLEANYYTLPNQIREYERSGQLCGFTSEQLKTRRNGDQVRLAEPWALIPLKMPVWRPDMDIEPINYTGETYSLYSDAHTRKPIETQNYGTSMLHTSFESWSMLRQAIASLGSSRVNAAMIDRLITANTDGLDAARAAEYINLIAEQLKKDRQEVVTKSQKTGVLPTVMNTLVPVLGGSKGGLQIETFSTDPNINHIEDIMFHLKRMAGALGVDSSLLGFGDLLSGGLGDGGFFRTSIQAALRANHIRSACVAFIKRAIDIHTIFRDGKVWHDEDAPFEIRFNSLNTAIQQEEAAAQESNVNYATTLATVLDLIENSPINKSETLKTHLYTSVLEMEPDLAKKVIGELAKKVADDKGMMESLGMDTPEDAERYVRDVVLDLLTDLRE
ncbi:portal protein [Vibrio marisflavi]|uniref:Phage portal protein n=1 Tax=Vibrio marisflavi CECT 7928 TaxID=634439 RepID=A0ABM9A9D6_9VIBR|nr:portal protein [Vibrio marisflavi]CAH0543132.1 hypothetical protein VMF7928_04416 [Vibrio marisflavi CECT 7928]